MRFSDDPCYHCEGNIIIDFKSYRKKVIKLLCYPYRCFKRFCFKDLEQFEKHWIKVKELPKNEVKNAIR